MKTQNALLYVLGLGVVLALMLLALVAHAQSIMSPIDDHGQMVDDHMPFESIATPEQKLEWFRAVLTTSAWQRRGC
jgi:hypothetical protein